MKKKLAPLFQCTGTGCCAHILAEIQTTVPGCYAHILTEIQITFNLVHTQFLVKFQLTFWQVNSRPCANPNNLFLAVLGFVSAIQRSNRINLSISTTNVVVRVQLVPSLFELKTKPKKITGALET